MKSLRVYVEALVHPSARLDSRARIRHFFFIATRLSVGLCAFAILPLYLAARGVPPLPEAIVYCWLLLPLFIALYLSRTGAWARAHIISAAAFAVPLGLLASRGGFGFAPWVALVPIEAVLFCAWPVALGAGLAALSAFGAAWAIAAFVLPAAQLTLVPDGGTFGLAVESLIAAYLVCMALGARKIAEREAWINQASEARYRSVAESTSELITSHGRNGAVAFASPAAESLLGVPASRLLGHGLFDRVHIADRPAFLTAISEAMSKERTATVEYRLRREWDENDKRSEPSFVWVETRCHRGDAGKPVVAVTRDISSRKAAELALEAARAEAERANDAKYRFLATVSHELRTPLNAIIGFSEILTRSPSSDIRPDYAKLIHDSGEHLLAVVNSILDVSRIESGQFMIRPKSFPVASLIESTVEIMMLAAEQKGVRLSAEIAALPEIVADERALRQIVLNLLSNAIKFTREGGSVVIGARVEGGEFTLTVADSGIGIAEGDLKQLGNPFFQAHASYDRPYEGSGLGLSVVKGLVELHGGSIDIASRLGEGTKVVLRLPLDCRRHIAGSRRAILDEPIRAVVSEPEKVRRRA